MKKIILTLGIGAFSICLGFASIAMGQNGEISASLAAAPPSTLPVAPSAVGPTSLISQLAAKAKKEQPVSPGNNRSGNRGSVGQEAGLQNETVNASANDMYDEAFSGAVTQALPMSPEQISRLKMLFNDTQRAAAAPPGVPPRPVTTSLLVNLSPQAAPPVIRLGAGYITSLVFMDSTGQSWPIQAYSIGDPTSFNIQWDKKGNNLLIQAASFYKRSNLAVILKGLDTPVMLTLLSGQEVIDYRVDLRVPGIGPNGSLVQDGLPDISNPLLLDVLNGIPPKGSKTLKVGGGDCQAWLLNNRLFLRTSLDVISPAWKSVMSSIDGTHAYELQSAPVVLALQRGKEKTLILTIEGFE